MSKPDDPQYVRIERCIVTHKALLLDMGVIREEVREIKKALIGSPLNPESKGGIVGAIREIQRNSKSRLSGRDKAFIIGSFIAALGSIIVAILT